MEWFGNYKGDCELVPLLRALIADNEHDWAKWLIIRAMATIDYDAVVSYAIFTVKQVLNIYEQHYPNDNRPRVAIEKAEEFLQSKTKEATVAVATYLAADAADEAARDAYHCATTNAAAEIAFAIACVARAAVYTTHNNIAYTVARSAHVAIDTAVYAAALAANSDDAGREMQEKILNYGIKLLETTET